MKAALMTAKGDATVLKVTDVPTPTITKPNQVLVRLHAAGLNPVDIKMREGFYPVAQLPYILGWDGSGVVEAVGAEVTHIAPGDEVWTYCGSFGQPDAQGNYAEYVLANAENVSLKPKNLSFAEASAVPLALLTVWEALFDRANMQAGQTVLIHAGAGGVGHLAIQLAANAGATVYTTVSTPEKADFVKSLGATDVIDYKAVDFVEATLDLTQGEGVDIALDTVGGETYLKNVPAIKHYGDLVTLVKPAGDIDVSAARMKNLRLGFELVLQPLLRQNADEQRRQRNILDQTIEMFESEKLRIHVSRTFPLEDIQQAHTVLAEGSTTGKMVLVM
ncbi:MAG: zinc-dependent alcohol dehydrogenase family protein [Chloroflexota bacterium]